MGTMFVAASIISCDIWDTDSVKIINNSEYNITWVVIIDTETGYAVVSKRDDELIAKNGGFKAFKGMGKLSACVKAEDTQELMCTAALTLRGGVNHPGKTITIFWNGSGDPEWHSQQYN